MSSIRIHYASLDDLDPLTALFDAYRVFYQQASDPALARRFLHERMRLRESVMLLARDEKTAQPSALCSFIPDFHPSPPHERGYSTTFSWRRMHAGAASPAH